MPWKPLEGDEFPSLGYGHRGVDRGVLLPRPGDVQGEPVQSSTASGCASWSTPVPTGPGDGPPRLRRGRLLPTRRAAPRARSWPADRRRRGVRPGPLRRLGRRRAAGRAPVTSPLLKCLATEESQAGNTFENIAFIAAEWGPGRSPRDLRGRQGRQAVPERHGPVPASRWRDSRLHGRLSVQGRRQGNVRRRRRDSPVRAARTQGHVRDGPTQPRQAEDRPAVAAADDHRLPPG
jgi:hypothetical protein